MESIDKYIASHSWLWEKVAVIVFGGDVKMQPLLVFFTEQYMSIWIYFVG